MTWSPDQQLRLQNLLNGVETRPSIHNRVRAHERYDMAPEVAEVDMTFDDVVDIVNPLHHIPVVGTGYRAVTGDTISPHAQMIGGVLYGGPTGMFNAGLQAAIRQETGHNVDGLMLAMVTGEDVRPHPDAPDTDAPAPRYADARAAAAAGPAAEATTEPATQAAEIRQTPVPQAAGLALGPAAAGPAAQPAPAAPPTQPLVASAPPPTTLPEPAVRADTAGPDGGAPAGRPAAPFATWPSGPGAIGGNVGTAPAMTATRPLQNGPAPATGTAGPQVVLAPAAGSAPTGPATTPGQAVEISNALDAALMSLANASAAPPARSAPGAVAAAGPADDTGAQTRVADAAYRRTAGAVARY